MSAYTAYRFLMISLAILYLRMDGHFHMLLSSVQAYMTSLFSPLNISNLKYLRKREILPA